MLTLPYYFEMLPWQINNTLIFIFFLLVGYKKPRFAAVYATLFDKRNVCLSSGHQTNAHYMANRGKIRQSVTLKRIRTVYEYRVRVYTWKLGLSLKSEHNFITMNPEGTISWCWGQNIVILCLNLYQNLENFIFHSKFVLKSIAGFEASMYFWYIFKLIPDFGHSFPSPFGMQRVFGNLEPLFYCQRRIFPVVFLLEVYRDDNSFGCWREWFPHHFLGVPDY